MPAATSGPSTWSSPRASASCATSPSASRDSGHGQQIVNRLKHLAGVRVVNISDRTFLMHLGGKIEIHNKVPIATRDDLSMAYTPGVARVCLAIKEDRQRAFALTIKQNTVAVVTDGTAVLGLGDIGPEAALPVMEGKAMLFKEFAGVDAFPICLATKDPDKIVETVKVSAPRPSVASTWRTSPPPAASRSRSACARSSTSRFSTTISTARPWSCWPPCSTRCGSSRRPRGLCASWSPGSGAAGTATIKILQSSGVRDIVGVDEHGVIHRGRAKGMDFMKRWVATAHQPRAQVKGGMREAMHRRGRVHRAVGAAASCRCADVKRMARTPSSSRWPTGRRRSSRRRPSGTCG